MADVLGVSKSARSKVHYAYDVTRMDVYGFWSLATPCAICVSRDVRVYFRPIRRCDVTNDVIRYAASSVTSSELSCSR